MASSKLISNIQSPEKYVGFADLPNQIFRHCAMNGFEFNLMVVGESGLGKSTFINNLFTSEVYSQVKYGEKASHISGQTMEIHSSTVNITEDGVQLRLTLIDTPGYGDNIDNSSCWDKILAYVNQKHEEYLKWESTAPRVPIRDMRIHCCIYFISPTGHRLKPIDIDFLKKLHDKVNIITVIGKSDTLCHEDLIQFKKRINDDLKFNMIKTYDFPNVAPRDDEERDIVKSYLTKLPFGIVSSDSTIDINGKQTRVRKYPWGVCEVDNVRHCDFIPMRDLLLRTCVCHLIETTHTVLYEKYRSSYLGDFSGSKDFDGSPLDALEREKNKQNQHLENLKKQLEKQCSQQEEEYRNKLEELKRSNAAQLEAEEIKLLSRDSSYDAQSNGVISHDEKSKKTEDRTADEKLKKSKRKIFQH